MEHKELNEKEIQEHLAELNPKWKRQDKFIYRAFLFLNFKEAFAFMTEVAEIAEELNHHPNWENSYNKVNVSLTTHDAEGLTDLDFKLAKAIDEIKR